MKRLLPLTAVAIYAFLHLPLLVLAAFSVNASRFTVWQGLSWRWYRAAAVDGSLMEAAWNSLVVAFAATLISTVIGTLCAYGLWKRGSKWLSMSLSLSLATPEIVLGIALLAFYQGLFRFLGARLGLHTVIAAHVSFCLAFVVLVVAARLKTMDRTLEEAAMDLGASEAAAFWRVTLPNLTPAIISAALLAFTISFDDYVITSLVAGVDSETLPMQLYALARRGANPVVNAVATLIVFGLGFLILAAERLNRRRC